MSRYVNATKALCRTSIDKGMLKVCLLLLCLALAAPAQVKMNVDQLKQMVKSSLDLKHDDKKIAEYLKKVQLTERLDDRTIEDFMGMGAKARTIHALQDLRDQSANLTPAKAAPAKPLVSAPAAPDSVEQQRILDLVRQYAASYAKSMPDFICVQVTRRFVDPTHSDYWRLMDVFTAKLSYSEGRENYQVVLVNNRSVNTSMEKLGGATSQGEFVTLMRDAFAKKSQARFEWDHWGTLRGKRTAVFNYSIDATHSTYSITYDPGKPDEQQAITAYRGLVYADKDTGVITRMTFEAIDIPPGFPVKQAATILDYDDVDISGTPHVLPLKAQVRMRAGQFSTRNDQEYRMYKKFGSDVTITFEPEPLPEDQTKEQKEGTPPAGPPTEPAPK